MQAMRSLFASKEFLKIKSKFLQIELLHIIGMSSHFCLVESLEKILQEANKMSTCDHDLEEAIEDTILQLKQLKRIKLNKSNFENVTEFSKSRASMSNDRPMNISSMINRPIFKGKNSIVINRHPSPS